MTILSSDNTNLVARVRKIGGQVAAIERAFDAGTGCTEVLHLVAAVRGAVSGLLDEIIAEHLISHVAQPGLTNEQRAEGARELLAVIRRYAK
ncbi:metal/formaldehyde-sensitive transcriptional repressor [Acetobacter persici]|uniref:metal/formaldehyde-sensitive transcriptional repressor n=1 Tax=Acetobacter persici TaxID=1076596 RepID=UPI0039E7BB32